MTDGGDGSSLLYGKADPVTSQKTIGHIMIAP